MIQSYVALALAIGCFGIYPMIVRSAGAVGMVSPLILVVCSLLPISIFIGYTTPSFSLSTGTWLRLVIGGVLMGIGFIGFAFLLAHPRLEFSRVIPLLNIATLLLAVVGGIVFFSEALTLQKILGAVMAVVAIILLRPQG